MVKTCTNKAPEKSKREGRKRYRDCHGQNEDVTLWETGGAVSQGTRLTTDRAIRHTRIIHARNSRKVHGTYARMLPSPRQRAILSSHLDAAGETCVQQQNEDWDQARMRGRRYEREDEGVDGCGAGLQLSATNRESWLRMGSDYWDGFGCALGGPMHGHGSQRYVVEEDKAGYKSALRHLDDC